MQQRAAAAASASQSSSTGEAAVLAAMQAAVGGSGSCAKGLCSVLALAAPCHTAVQRLWADDLECLCSIHAVLCHAALCCATVLLRYSAGSLASILWSAGVKDKSEVGEVIGRLEAAGMPTLDISGMEAARVSGARQDITVEQQLDERTAGRLTPCKPASACSGASSSGDCVGQRASHTSLTHWECVACGAVCLLFMCLRYT